MRLSFLHESEYDGLGDEDAFGAAPLVSDQVAHAFDEMRARSQLRHCDNWGITADYYLYVEQDQYNDYGGDTLVVQLIRAADGDDYVVYEAPENEFDCEAAAMATIDDAR